MLRLPSYNFKHVERGFHDLLSVYRKCVYDVRRFIYWRNGLLHEEQIIFLTGGNQFFDLTRTRVQRVGKQKYGASEKTGTTSGTHFAHDTF